MVLDMSISGMRVVSELGDLIAKCDTPKMIVSYNGTELTSDAVLAWLSDPRVEWHCIAPGKPTQNSALRASMAACATCFSTRRCSSRSAGRHRAVREGTPTGAGSYRLVSNSERDG
jgi:hypothetical protein